MLLHDHYIDPEHLAYAIYGEDGSHTFHLGWLVAQRLNALADMSPAWGNLRRSLIGAAVWIERHSDRSQRPLNPHLPEQGLVSVRPLWACLLARDGRTGPLGGDAVRLLLLVLLIARISDGCSADSSAARKLHALIKQLDAARAGRLSGAVVTLLERPSSLAASTANQAALQALESVSASAQSEAGLLQTLKVATDLLTETSRNATHSRVRRAASFEEEVLTAHVRGARDGESIDDIRIGAVTDVPLTRRARDDSLIRSGWLCTVTLAVDGNGPQSLTALESRGAAKRLAGWISPNNPAQPATASLIVLLGLLTSEGARDIVLALESQATSGSSEMFAKDEHGAYYLQRVVPGSEKHHVIGLPLRRETDSHFLLPLPGLVSEALARALRDPQSLNWSELGGQIKAVEQTLRETDPRYFETRARLTIPSLIFGAFGEIADAQIIAGQDLGMSDAPLAYYSVPYATIIERWRSAAYAATGLEVVPHEAKSRSRWIGAPITAIEDGEFRRVPERHAAAIRAADSDLVALHDGLAIYAAHIFAATTGHRCHDSIGSLSWRDIDPINGVCVFFDKPAGQVEASRRCAVLGSVFLEQAFVLLELRRHIANGATPSAQAQEEAAGLIEEHSPLFALLGGDGFRCVRSADIAQPSDPLPRHAFRSRLRMHLTAAEVCPRLIYSQLGHIWNGCTPFGGESIESVKDARNELASAIDAGLGDDGWAVHVPHCLPWVVRQRLTRNSVAAVVEAWPRMTISDDMVREGSQSASGSASPCRPRGKIASDAAAEVRRWVDSQIRYLDHGEGTHVGRDKMKGAVIDLAETFAEQPAVVQAALRTFAAAILSRRRSASWTGAVPPLAHTGRPLPCPIDTPNIRASYLSSLIRRAAISPEGGSEALARWARTALLLLLDRHVGSSAALFAALSRISTQEFADGEAPTEVIGFLGFQRSGGREGTLRLSRELAYLSVYLAGEPMPPKRDIARKAESMFREFLPRGIKTPWAWLSSLARLAGKVEAAGILWNQVDDCDPGTLSIQRSRAWVEGRAGIEFASATSNSETNDPPTSMAGRPGSAAPAKRRMQYNLLRKRLYRLCEPRADKRKVPAQRYARAGKLVTQLVQDVSTDELVVLLAQYVAYGLSAHKRPRLGTVYSRLTTIGLRMVNALGDRSLTGMNEEELTEFYVGILVNTSVDRRPEVAAQLYKFHRCHARQLAGIDTYALRMVAAAGWPGAPDTGVINFAEYELLNRSISDSFERGRVSKNAFEDLVRSCELLYKDGLRVGEITHAPLKHLGGNGKYLVVRPSTLGTTKTRNAERIVGTSVAWPTPGSRAPSPNSPLLLGGGDWELRATLTRLREHVDILSAGDARSLHHLRHASFCWGLSSLRLTANRDAWLTVSALSRSKGHSRVSTSLANYWHLEHLAAAPLPREPLTSSELSVLTGLKPGTIRKRRSERGGVLLASLPAALPACPPPTVPELFPRFPIEQARVEGLIFVVAIHAGWTVVDAAMQCALNPGLLTNIMRRLRDIVVQYRICVLPPDALATSTQFQVDYYAVGRCRKLRLNKIDIASLDNIRSLRCDDPTSVLTAYRRKSGDWTGVEKSALQSTIVQRESSWSSPTLRASVAIAAIVWATRNGQDH